MNQLSLETLAPAPPARSCISDDLTASQREAVLRRDRSLALTATAGSGKTRVLVERFVCAVLEDGLAPERILAITFTDKAAHELQARVRRRFALLGERDAARDSEAAFITTIHGFCARLLRIHPLAAGLGPDFAVCDEATAQRLRRRAFDSGLRAFMAGDCGVSPERALDVVASFGVRRIESAIDGVHERLRSRGQRSPRLPDPRPHLIPASDVGGADAGREGAAPADRGAEAAAVVLAGELDALLQAVGAAYARLKRSRNLLDFDDLELEALGLLRRDDALRSSWSERFELLMVDEFQDTNPRQAELIGMLERDNLFVVGDEFQSIYGFRFADPATFRARYDALAQEGASIALAENFRSRPEILEAVNAAFAPRFGERFVRLRPARDEPDDGQPRVELLITDCAGWDGGDLGPGATGGSATWRRAEARAIAQRIAALLAAGAATPAETLVLLRAGTNMAIYERALVDAGLRTLAIGGGLWGALEISDLLAYLRALANPRDTVALYTLLLSPLVGVSADAVALLAAAAGGSEPDPWRLLRAAFGDGDPGALALLAPLEARDTEPLAAFVPAFDAERRRAPLLGVDRLLARVLESSGYRALLAADPAAERRLANVAKLMRIARRLESGDGRGLRGFLDHVESQRRGAAREATGPIDSEQSDAVRLMTIHNAKGLEADLVCVADLGRTRPVGDKPWVLVDRERLGISVPLADGSFAEALDYGALRDELRGAEALEEDRILYVAMTRARERLLLSGAADIRGSWPRESQTSPPLTWLGPALVDGLEERLEQLAQSLPARRTIELGARADRSAAPDSKPRLALTLNAPAPAPASAIRADERTDTRPGAAAAAMRPGWRGLPAPPPPRVAPVALSYSGLSDYAACGYRYYLQRVLGLPELDDPATEAPRPGGLDARSRGTIVHALLEQLDFAAPRPPTPAAIRAVAAAVAPAATLDACALEQLAALTIAFARSPLCERLARADAGAVAREQQFAFALEDPVAPLLNGYIDVIAREAGGAVLVVDYKTDAVAPDADLERLTAADYGAQRVVYALAALRSGADSVEVAHCYLERPEQLVSAGYRAEQAVQLEAEVEALAAGILANRFEPTAHPHRHLCAGCPGRPALCSWDLNATAGDP